MMSRVVCPECGSTAVCWTRDDADYAHYTCLSCKQGFCYPTKTLFEHITESPEALAPHFVFLKAVFVTNINPKQQWISTITDEVYPTKGEAIVATLARLNSLINNVKDNVK